MQAEGLSFPEEWLGTWTILSAVLNTGMAITEGAAIAYIFNSWHRSTGVKARRLLIMSILMVGSFSVVLMPFIAASVSGVNTQTVLSNPGVYWIPMFWSIFVVLSTGLTVMAVGIAQDETKDEPIYCWCGYEAESEQDLANHEYAHGEEALEGESAADARRIMLDRYSRSMRVLPEPPSLVEVARFRSTENDSNLGLGEQQ